MNGALRAALVGKTDAMGEFIKEEMPKPEGCDAWEYRDIPWVDGALWNHVVDTAGLENLRLIAMTDRGGQRRGQLWVSPEGCARLKEYSEGRPS